jgi:hypothetical protein
MASPFFLPARSPHSEQPTAESETTVVSFVKQFAGRLDAAALGEA